MTTTYKVQQLNLATRQVFEVLATPSLEAALARMNRPGASYLRVVQMTGRRTFRVLASTGAAPVAPRYDREQAADIRRQQFAADAYERSIEREEGR